MRRERENGRERVGSLFEEIMVKKSPSLRKEMSYNAKISTNSR